MDNSVNKNELDLTIFVPSYNEQNHIIKTLEMIQSLMSCFNYSYEVLIYDDHSTDDSAEVIKNYISANNLQSQFKLKINEKNRGIGINYFNAAREGKGEYFLIIHGDIAIPFDDLRKILDLLGSADIIIPYYETRILRVKYNYDHRRFIRRLLSLIFTNIVHLISGFRLRYFNGAVLHRRKNVLKNQVKTYGLGFMAELLCKILKDPNITYLEVKQHNYALNKIGTTAFKIKNVISVAKSLMRIFLNNFK